MGVIVLLHHRDVTVNAEIDAIYRVIRDPVEMFLEYRLIALDTPKASAPISEREFYDELGAELGLRYCILIICIDRYGGTETKFLYDVSRDRTIAQELLRILCEGAVTPCTASYILEDLL